jgi:hypothetical protein
MYPYLIHRSDGHGRPALTPRTRVCSSAARTWSDGFSTDQPTRNPSMLLVLYDLSFKAHPEVSSATCREHGEDHSCVHHGCVGASQGRTASPPPATVLKNGLHWSSSMYLSESPGMHVNTGSMHTSRHSDSEQGTRVDWPLYTNH